MAFDLNNYFPADPNERGNTANTLAKIIYELHHSRSHLASIESEYGELGKRVVRDIVTQTTVWMTYLVVASISFILAIGAFNLNISNQKIYGLFSFFGLYFVSFLIIWLKTHKFYKKIVNYNSEKNYGKRKKELEAIEKEILEKDHSLNIKKLIPPLFFSPFALRTTECVNGN